jgi:hypothetical protein
MIIDAHPENDGACSSAYSLCTLCVHITRCLCGYL